MRKFHKGKQVFSFFTSFFIRYSLLSLTIFSYFDYTAYLLKGNGKIFLFSYLKELLRLYIYDTLLPFFHIVLTSTNILIERNEMSAILPWSVSNKVFKTKKIFNFCRYECHVTTGVTQYFYLDNP